jgi:nucleoside-diphosphate-sugar epimerase
LAGIAHVSGQIDSDAAQYWRVNVDGTQSLVDAAADAGINRFVYFSSVKAVADPDRERVDETWDLVPEDAYGRSKREAESRVLEASKGGLDVCVLRPTLVYGPGVKGNLQRMLEAVASGRFPPIPEVGNRRSMVSVRDLAEAAWLAMTKESARGQTYIVADGVDYSTRDIYIAMCQALGRKAPSWCLPLWVLAAAARGGDFVARASGKPMPVSSAALERLCGSACYRADRIRAELGWEPVDDFYRVVGQMVESVGPYRVKS